MIDGLDADRLIEASDTVVEQHRFLGSEAGDRIVRGDALLHGRAITGLNSITRIFERG